jgi:hypothetical protein
MTTRRVFVVFDDDIMYWADVPAGATCIDIGATDTPDGDLPPIISIDYTKRLMEREDNAGLVPWPAEVYEPDQLTWTAMPRAS